MADPREDIMKKLQGIKDSRGPVGQLARGNNVYPGGNAARTGGGPGIGRPPEAAANPAIQQAMGRMQAAQQGPAPQAAAPAQANAQQRMTNPASPMTANPATEKMASKLARVSMQAAAKRRNLKSRQQG